MGSKNKRKKNKNNNLGVVKDKTEATNIQTLPDCQSNKVDSLSIKQDPESMTDSEKLFEKVKAKVEALKAVHNIPSSEISASTPEKAYPLENTIENGEQGCLGDLPTVTQTAEVTADANPLVPNMVHKPEDIKKKKKMKKKKKTTDIKIQTPLEQSANISPIVVGSCPTTLDPVKESFGQELPKYEVPETVLNFGTNLEISKSQNEKITVVQQKKKKKKMKKSKKERMDFKIQTLLKQSGNISSIVGCCPTCFQPLKESLVQKLLENTELESLPQKQDPISKKDSEKSLEEVKVNTEALKAAGNINLFNIPYYDMSASTPDKAYPLEKIIEKEEWDCLGDLLNLSPGAKLTPDAYPIFVCNRVQKLDDIKDEHEKITVAGVLQYITHLIKYKDKHSTDCKSVKNHQFPSIIEEKFRTVFNESSSRSLSSGKRKLLINYVLVLTLFVDGYQSDATDIAKDLRMDAQELKKQFEWLGCKIVDEKSVLLATLPVPLNIPGLRRSTKKRKR